MAASTQPIFPNVPLFGSCAVTAATTGRTVTGVTGLTQIALSGTNSNGMRIDRIRIVQNGAIASAPSANVFRVWIYAGTGNAILMDEYAIVAPNTPSATVAGYALDTNYTTLVLPTGYSLYASVHTYAGAQDGYNVELFGGLY